MLYSFHQQQILRTPLKPIKTSFSNQELHQLYQQKEVQEALFLASPNLLGECKKWLKGELTDKTEEEKLVFSLLKYALRMHSRCTPYGLFAGCGVIENISDTITITTQKTERNTRLDMNFTCALAQELAKLSYVQPYLKFYPNSSIYTLQNKIRYVEYRYKENRRIHQISAVDNSVYLQAILQKAQHGGTLSELAQSLTDEEITTSEALEFLQELVVAQLLVSELEPAVTGEELLSQILSIISPLEERLRGVISVEDTTQLQNIVSLLLNTQRQFSKIDEQIGNPISIYEELAENLKQLNIPFDLNKLFQTDLYINVSVSPLEMGTKGNPTEKNSEDTQIQLTKALTLLNRLSLKPTKTNLAEFQRKFYERYEYKEVALQEVLDNETGIGYAQNTNHTGDVNPLINDLILPHNNNQETFIKMEKHFLQLPIELIATQPISPFSFPFAVVFLMNHFSSVLEKNYWDDRVIDLFFRILDRYLIFNKNTDFLLGQSGLLQLLISLPNQEGEIIDRFIKKSISNIYNLSVIQKDNSLALPYIDSYDLNKNQLFLGGFAHGSSGISASILRYAALKNDFVAETLGLKILEHDRSQFITEIKGWRDGREGLDKYDAGCWCHGSAGIALSRLMISDKYSDNIINRELLIAKENIIKTGIGGNQSLCHGDLGNLEILRAIGTHFNDNEIKYFVQNYLSTLILKFKNGEAFKTGEDGTIPLVNLFMGEAGIGYGFLRQYDWENVPSILSLESPKNEFLNLHKL